MNLKERRRNKRIGNNERRKLKEGKEEMLEAKR